LAQRANRHARYFTSQAAAIIPSVSRVNDVNDDAISKDNGERGDDEDDK